MYQREILNALEEELRVNSKPLKYTVSNVEPDGPRTFKVFINPAESSHRGLDDSLEGAAAWWAGPPKGSADVLSVAAEHDQINIRFPTSALPNKGDEIRIYPPRYLEALKEIWESPLFSVQSLLWLEKMRKLEFVSLPDVASIPGYPKLRKRQRQAFGLLDQNAGFLWGPPGTGKTYTVGAMLANFLSTYPAARVLLLSTTNSAVDLALISVDERLEERERNNKNITGIRGNIKRIGNHFIAGSYRGREHLLPVTDHELIKRIAELETQMPDKSDAAKYGVWKDRIDELRSQIPRPIQQARLAAMTTTAAAFSFSTLRDLTTFDLIVFDEASQVSLPHALALAPLAKRAIFVGDHKQLAPIVVSDHPDVKKWLGTSMFKYMTPKNRCLLNEQSRMADEICEIVSHVFYDGELILAGDCDRDPVWRAERRVQRLARIGTERVHVERCQEEGTFKQTKYGIGTRFESAQKVSNIAADCAMEVGEDKILVLTPYRAQRSLIKALLRNVGRRNIRVSTIHRAQGSECHTVIFDPVFTSGEKLLGHPEEGPRLINVALSRAKARLVVILSNGDLSNEYLGRVAQAIKGNGQFDNAVALGEVITHPGFPVSAIGTVVRWRETVGPIEPHHEAGSFYINDFRTGQRKTYKTSVVRGVLQLKAASVGSS
jgi:DNA replication ATP-dependent helicase Dna2